MALLWADSFDDLATATGVNVLNILDRRYSVSWTSTATITTYTGRLGGYSLTSSGTHYLTLNKLEITTDTTIVGLALRAELNSTSLYRFLEMCDGNQLGVNFRIRTDTGEVYAYLDTTLLGIGKANIRTECWCYVEVKVKCHSTEGSVEVRVGGTTVLSLTGINTQAGAHTYHDVLWLHLNGYQLDDLYVADTTGSVNNDFLGNVTVKHLFPTGDEGTNQWTPSTGTSHYALVDEGVENDDTDSVSSSTTDQIELWTYGDVSGVGDIFGVNVFTICNDTDTPIGLLKLLAKSGTTVFVGPAQVVGNADYGVRTQIVELDPDTSALWTDTGLNAASFGVKVG